MSEKPFADQRAEFVEFYLVSDNLEAELVVNILSDDSIHVKTRVLRDTPFPVQTNIQEGVRIAVPRNHLLQAKEVVERARLDGIIPLDGVFLV